MVGTGALNMAVCASSLKG